VDNRFAQLPNRLHAHRLKEDRVTADPLGHPRHGGLRASSRAGDLPMCRAGCQSRRHLDEKLTALQVVRRRERLPRAGLPACFATEAWYARRILGFPVGAPLLESQRWASMSDALRPRTEGWMEPSGTHRFGGVLGPAHDERPRKTGAQQIARNSVTSFTGDCPDCPLTTPRPSTTSRPPWPD
jgi:hypothetical protein